jgi:hypothetical protein
MRRSIIFAKIPILYLNSPDWNKCIGMLLRINFFSGELLNWLRDFHGASADGTSECA